MIRAIVLAAGKGTRMQSARPKVLHELCGRPMLWYVLQGLRDAGIDDVVVVVASDVRERIATFGVRTVVQTEQRGTGDAVRAALDDMPEIPDGRIVIASGDMPLISGDVFSEVAGALEGEGVDLALVTVKVPLPSSFGRIVRRDGAVAAIVEAKDATPEQLAIDETNAGVYAYSESALREAIRGLRDDNAQREFYLTDTIGDIANSGRRVHPVTTASHEDAIGINDRIDLARARRAMNERLCERHMRAGVTIIDPATTYLEPELTIGRDTVIYPNTTISRLSQIGEGCVIGPNVRLSFAIVGDGTQIRESVVVDSTIGRGVTIGPYSHVRAQAMLDDEVQIGNFVEIKKSKFAAGSKAKHLSYVGDAIVGEEANIGAGTITANYDGSAKHETNIGRDVSIGSNSSLVAPVTIGDGALTGAGSVVTRDVAPGERVAGNPARPLPKKSE
ncbi:MAG TPA: bifunctional UDP-N-acetylglucosamine diphosphorylase/glucosamine-1-phosphate N-acetyltransferase GlmU [Candidatus Tumulicola sp.]|jgi:bifunctional UDP-N-acetylglucosamine pyrophosphorylase/glucosamine-1-phosphate N-acetyltransferase